MEDRESSSRGCPWHSIDIPGDHDPHVDALLAPRAKEASTLRCRVRRVDRHQLELFVEAGYTFVLSAVRSGRDWLISDRPLQSAGKRGHIARLRAHKDSSYTCVRSRHEESNVQPEILFVRHCTREMDDDLPPLNVLQGAFPLPPADEFARLHPWERERLCLGARLPPPAEDLAAGELAMQTRLAVENKQRPPEGVAVVVSRMPKWNERSQTYELPFVGRANWASARNFQLVEQGGSGERVILLYGKMEENEFAMDFAHPLSFLHAFAICLTTFAW
ncbi:hypothetical protein AB1Y20_023554 [Prymnesium parvum]|uniref:Tubby C-terminal domain-containing protein n=1 Tax=Prymnesium parvum TaxID=97485 RepID=A0AB34JE26_PRYPA